MKNCQKKWFFQNVPTTFFLSACKIFSTRSEILHRKKTARKNDSPKMCPQHFLACQQNFFHPKWNFTWKKTARKNDSPKMCTQHFFCLPTKFYPHKQKFYIEKTARKNDSPKMCPQHFFACQQNFFRTNSNFT